MAFSNIVNFVPSQSKNMYILLACHNNMASHGGIMMNMPPECNLNTNILKLNVEMQWKEAKELFKAYILMQLMEKGLERPLQIDWFAPLCNFRF